MIALLAVVASVPQTAGPTASSLISKTFARYGSASVKSVAGTIRWTNSANGTSIITDTQMQFERPDKVYVLQKRAGSNGRTWLLTSDGSLFSYDKPDELFGHERFVERVHVHDAVHDVDLTTSDIFQAAGRSLGDREAPLKIAFGRKEDLRGLLATWPNFRLAGKRTVNGREVNVIVGDLAVMVIDSSKPFDPTVGPAQKPEKAGSFELCVTDEGDLVRYATKQAVSYPQVSPTPIEVNSVWDVNLVVNGGVRPELFTVIK